MKVLFGMSSNDVVNSICSLYQNKYKENIENESAYYFKNLIASVNKSSYDRIVISEELEPFATNNYETIDKYLFSEIDKITDEFEAKNIIFIASERRSYSDPFILKLFNIGLYSVLIGQERTLEGVTQYINNPRQKKDIKQYLEEGTNKNAYAKAEVSEIEIQRIQSYYQKLGNQTDKYVETFEKISNQYTNEQLTLIIRFLPDNVTSVLSETSSKYKEILKLVNMEFNPNAINDQQGVTEQKENVQNKINIQKQPEILEKIVVKQQNNRSTIMTEVIEKEVFKEVFEVPKDYKKVACFIGAPKVGTTFVINALARFYSSKGLKVAIIDMTKKKEHYYIYSEDKESKRDIAAESLKYASNNMYEPLVNNHISVFTSVPYEDRKLYKANTVIEVARQHNNVVLIDCDFSTPLEYFKICQEIYLIQDMDVLNIHQNTMFLRELKSREISISKVNTVINKYVKTKLTAKSIIEGLASYSNPEFTMIDEIFDIEKMQYFVLQFEQGNYEKYTEMMYLYKNFFPLFGKDFKDELHSLANSVYPTGGNPKASVAIKKSPEISIFTTIKNLFGNKKNGNDEIKFEKIIQ